MITFEKISDFKNPLTAKAVTLWTKEKLQKNFDKFNEFVNGTEEYMIGKNGDSRLSRHVAKYYLNMFSNEIENRKNHPDWYGITEETEKSQENVVPATIVKNPTPTMENETATGTSNAGETNVKKVLHKNVEKHIAKPKKNNYINTTNETKTTKTTNSNGYKTMMNKNEIAKIAPNAVKKIIAAQKTNKTDTKKTYWGGWAKVRAGMNAAYNDYTKYQNLETEWLELRQKLGGTKSPLYHFCWSLINKNRVGVKQEPNSTLRFIKNAKIRIAMANDVLANKNQYENEIAENWKKTFGTEI